MNETTVTLELAMVHDECQLTEVCPRFELSSHRCLPLDIE